MKSSDWNGEMWLERMQDKIHKVMSRPAIVDGAGP